MCAALVRVCEAKPYALIEHLTAQLYAALQALIPATAHAAIELTKVAPPIAGLEGGISFAIAGGDEPSKRPSSLARSPA